MSYQQALQDIKLGYYEAAIAKLDPLLHTDPSQPKLWYAKTLALLSLQRFGEAMTTAQLSVKLNPTWAPGYQLLGNACSQLGDKKGAIAAYKQATHFYLDQGDKTQAKTCLEKLKAFKPQFIPNHEQSLQESNQLLDQVALKQEQGSHKEALEDLNWLLHLDPHNVQALANRGLLQAKAQNYREALADISLAMQLCPDDLNLQLQRGKIRLWLQDSEGAIADFSALLTTDWGDHAEIYCLRGQAYQQRNDLETAFEDLANALYLDPHNQECYWVRGDIYRGMEEWEEALSNYRRALSLSLEQGNWLSHKQVQEKIKQIERQLERDKQEAARIIRVPIKRNHSGIPIIDVQLNDSVSCEMMLDTGAGMVCITGQIARLLNVVPMGTKHFSLADGRVIEKPVGYVRSLALEKARVENLEVSIEDNLDEGLIGQNYLWRYDVRILQTEVELYLR